MYSLKNYKPYADVLQRRDEVQKKIELIAVASSAAQDRVAELEAEAAQVLASGKEGYIKKMDEVKTCGADASAIEQELQVLNSALELVEAEITQKEREAKNQIMARARADHAKIVVRGIAAVKDLLQALAEEEALAKAVQRPLGGAGFLAMLAGVFHCRESDLRFYRERLQAKGYNIEQGGR